MSVDVENILDLLIVSEKNSSGIGRYICETRIEKITLSLAILCVFISAIPIALGKKELALYILAGAIGLAVIYMLASIVPLLTSFFSFKRDALISVKNEHNSNIDFAAKLAIYDLGSLNEVKRLLERRVIFLVDRIGFMVGAVDKLGLFPALFMLYFTYTKISDNSVSVFQMAAIAFICGLYIGVLLAKAVIDSFRDKIQLLELAMADKSKLKLP